MQSLQYAAPTTLTEAAEALGSGAGAKILAGGTDLLVQMKLGLRDPALIVDIKRIPELMDARDRARFMTMAENELTGLHEGNFARFRIRPSEFMRWLQQWK